MLAAVGGPVAHIDKLAYCRTTRFSFSCMTLSPWGQDFTQYAFVVLHSSPFTDDYNPLINLGGS